MPCYLASMSETIDLSRAVVTFDGHPVIGAAPGDAFIIAVAGDPQVVQFYSRAVEARS